MMRRQLRIYLLLGLIILNAVIFSALYKQTDRRLMVAFLDIGQGDAIFIETPSGHQMLIDGGPPGGAVLRELGKVMPFYDRSIDVVLATHADQDHIGGLPDVLNRFSVGFFVRSMTTTTSAAFQTLLSTIDEKKIKEEIIVKPENIDFGDGAEFAILFPDIDTSGWETNDASIVGKLIYGENSFLLTGDSPSKIELHLVQKYGSFLKSDVLKAGHHGSRTSTSPLYAETVAPIYGVISAGLNNKFNHPAKETIDTLNRYGVKILETLGKGMIVFKTDGENLTLLPQLFSK